MGCGSSQPDPSGGTSTDKRPLPKSAQNGTTRNNQNGDAKRISSTDSNANRTDTKTSNVSRMPPPGPLPKSVSFMVTLDGENVDNKLLGRPPPRLKRLDPLGVPTLTAEQLAEKQRIADEKREEILKQKVDVSQKSSKRRRELLMAQQFDAEQQAEQEKRLQESLTSAGKSKEAKLKDIQDKQRIREERAKRAREKAQKLKTMDQDLDLEVEKDEGFNADDDDSWLDGDNNDDFNSDTGERIYSGRTSPKKRYHGDGSANIHRGISASTIDSFDNAYNKKPPSASTQRTVDTVQEKDDFFDS